ncbi:MAG: glutathione peroxidase [Chthoniobacterales bacterium]
MKKILMLSLLICASASSLLAGSLTEIPFKTMDGKDATLNAYNGKVFMVINVASLCEHTEQYGGLEKLYKQYSPKGFVILGFPCNDFGHQEPGTNAEIKQFCRSKYNVTFPIFDKIHVKGPEQHPLYTALTGPGAKFPGDMQWNFGKFLINKNGEVVARFIPATQPDDAALVAAIDEAMK